MSLYPGYRPIGVRKTWNHASIGCDDAHNVLSRYGAPERLGKPTDAVAWFDEPSGRLRLLVADYPTGRRAELRIKKSGSSLSIVTPERSA